MNLCHDVCRSIGSSSENACHLEYSEVDDGNWFVHRWEEVRKGFSWAYRARNAGYKSHEYLRL